MRIYSISFCDYFFADDFLFEFGCLGISNFLYSYLG